MKIISLTGIRSEYDILYPLLTEIINNKIKLQLVVSGAHLEKKHGETWKMISKDGFNIVKKIRSLPSTNKLIQRPKAISILIDNFAKVIEKENPDIILVVGDREEAISAAIVGNYMKKIVLHIGGGDQAYGNSDDPIRFSISKLANIHCCTSLSSYNNLIKIGEERFRVFNTGNPYFSNIAKEKKITKSKLMSLLNIDNKHYNFIVFIKHPLSSELNQIQNQLKITFESVEKFCLEHNFAMICISPNSDPGSTEIVKYINKYKNKKWLYSVGSLPRNLFVNLMIHSILLIGNSSMGILEAPYYKLPVINIGNRQKGRHNAGNVKFVDYKSKKILVALKDSIFNKKYLQNIRKIKNPYGDKSSALKIIKVIKSIDLNNQKWYIKKNTFHE